MGAIVWGFIKMVATTLGPSVIRMVWKSITSKKKKGVNAMSDKSDQLRAQIEEHIGDLKKLKGFSYESAIGLVGEIVDIAKTSVPLWNECTADEKQEACVPIMNDLIDIPKIPEIFEGFIFNFIWNMGEAGYAKYIKGEDTE